MDGELTHKAHGTLRKDGQTGGKGQRWRSVA